MTTRYQCGECGAYTMAPDRIEANKKLRPTCRSWDEPHEPVARDHVLIVKQLRFDDFDVENAPELTFGGPYIKPTGGDP